MTKTSPLSVMTFVAVLAAPAWAGHEGCHGAQGGLWLAKPLLLATLALGWWVLRAAKSDAGWLKRVGQLVGWIVLLGSAAAFACTFRCHKKSACPAGGAGLHRCPTEESPAQAAAAAETAPPAAAKKKR